MYTYPHTIESGSGEQLTFVKRHQDAHGEWLEVENLVQPNSGPPMHTHWKQDECLTVMQGKLGTQILGQPEEFHEAGATIEFERGVPHRFWNAGTEPLVCKGWVRPAHNLEYFLTEIYRSTRENGGKQPSQFDGAWLLTRYKSEFDMNAIPSFVKKVIFPVTVFFGKLRGKQKRFKDAPEPVR
jgi:mannose-6-phosphate isomerase-like protein (cupin superfamily)